MAWYVDIGLYFWELFKMWLSALFVIPLQQPQLLWLLIPVWLSGGFAEFFQEKKGTSMGNAVSNATITLWGSIDWTRQTVSLYGEKVISGFGNMFFRSALILMIFAYSFGIIFWGIKGNKIIKKIGRVREVTYVLAVFTPIFYGVMPLSFNYIFAAFIFFPLFYEVVEFIDWITPNPKPIEQDLEEGQMGAGGLGGGMGGMEPGMGMPPEQKFDQGLDKFDFGKGEFKF